MNTALIPPETRAEQEPRASVTAAEPVIRLRGVTKTYGAGKTTIISMLLGLLTLTSWPATCLIAATFSWLPGTG